MINFFRDFEDLEPETQFFLGCMIVFWSVFLNIAILKGVDYFGEVLIIKNQQPACVEVVND